MEPTEILERIRNSTGRRMRGGWTLDDEALMVFCAECGLGSAAISRLLGRTQTAVSEKATRLGVRFLRSAAEINRRNMDRTDEMSTFYRWTPERVELLRNCWEKGLPVRQIRALLHELTGKAPGKNSVIGKAERMGLGEHPMALLKRKKPVTIAPPRPAIVSSGRPVSLPPIRFFQPAEADAD